MNGPSQPSGNVIFPFVRLELPEGNVLGPQCIHLSYMGPTKRTTIQMTDERQWLLEQAKDIIAAGLNDDPRTLT